MIGECGGVEQLENQIVRRIVGRGDLLQYDVFLALQLVDVEHGIAHDVSENIQRQRPVVAQDARIVGGSLHAGTGIEVATHPLDLRGDVHRAAPSCSLERNVFQKVRDAALMRLLVTGPGLDPNAQRHRLEMRQRLGQDVYAVGKTRYVNRHGELIPGQDVILDCLKVVRQDFKSLFLIK